MPGQENSQIKDAQTPVINSTETVDSSQEKVSKSGPAFSLSSLFKSRSATKIPKAAFGNTSKPPMQSSTSSIRPPRKGGLPMKKILIIVMGFMLLIILVLVVALMVKSRPQGSVGERGKLTWWGQRDEEIVQPLIEEYQREHPEVKIVYQKQDPADYRVRLKNLMSKEEAPDIFSLHNTWTPMFKANLDILPSSVMQKDDYQDIFYPAIVSSLQSSSGFLGIPIGYDALVLFINQDLFATAFASPPETWDDFKVVARYLTDAPEDRLIQSGAAMGLTSNVDHWEEIIALLMLQNGVSLSKPAGSRANAVFDYYNSFSGEKGGVWNTTLPESVAAFANGKLAMLFAPTYRANEIRKINPDLNFITVPVPQIQQDNPEDPDITYAVFWFEGVWNRSVNNDIAWDFLKYLTEKDSQIKISDNYRSQGLYPEVFPRKDMRILIKDDYMLGSVVNLAESSVSWYLAGDTKDGEGGFNYKLSKAFQSGVEDNNPNIVSDQVQAVLSEYGVALK